MITKIKSQKPINRDGTSQQDRALDALHPEYVQVEGRSVEELVREAQRLAEEIRFFDETNQDVSNWELLFVDNVEEYHAKSETGKEIQRKRWAKQLAAYVENPESFQNDSDRLARLSRPHVVLFMTFLKLMNHVKSQINGLTKKHLDFYFLERLGFTPREAMPDVVNVLLELATNVNQLEVKEGTVLFAGNDEEGNELLYTTNRNTIINEAQITQIKTVFVEKNTLSIKDAHLNNRDDLDDGFTRMMEMALGSPNPGDALPPLPAGVQNLLDLIGLLDQSDAAAIDYVTNQLYFPTKDNFKDFRLVIQTQVKDQETGTTATPQEWEEVYRLLDQAFKNRTKKKRQLDFKELRESEGPNGFDALLKHVFGSPNPGDDLPLYRGSKASVLDVYADLIAPENNNDPARTEELKAKEQEAIDYIISELFLTKEDFAQIIQISQNPQATDQDWAKVYEFLELADRKVRSQPLLSPFREDLFDIYAEPDARASAFSLYGEAEESVRFKTFGGSPAGTDHPLNPAPIGLAISSPIFLLEEGKRHITATVAFDPESGEMETLSSLFHTTGDNFPPFKVFLSAEKEWFQPTNVNFTVGDYIVGSPESVYTATIAGDVVTKNTGDAFGDKDAGKYLVWTDGTVYEILQINAGNKVRVRKAGMVDAPAQIQKYAPQHIYLNAMEVRIDLQEEDLPFVPITFKTSDQSIQSEFPAMILSLNHALVAQQGKQSYLSHYQKLMDLKMGRVHLKVDVQGIRNVIVQNDLSILDTKKPFEPFGYDPEIGNSFYLANKEISNKRLDDLSLDVQWMKAPADFSAYYQNYWLIDEDDANLNPASYTIKSNEDFEARVTLLDNRAELELAGVGLFPQDGKIKITSIPDKIQGFAPSFQYKSSTDYQSEEKVLDWDRYFKIELDKNDFQHSVYNGLFGRQALSEDPAIRKLRINPPYTPKLKSIKVGYASHTEIIVGETHTSDQDKLFHLHPFGYSWLKPDAGAYLLPEYKQEGALYLGIDKLTQGQPLSVLFQMSEGSANPDVEKPTIQWSYLKGNEWLSMNESAILSDGTNGLMNTGIIQLNIPSDATNNDTLMPGQLIWLKISCDRNTAGISDTIQILAQAISATFSSKQVAANHFVDLLPPNSITETLDFNPGIKKIAQPYTSSKGKPVEQDDTFYNRISERLRHKNRAITMWDYERMVLEQFPEVYKVKCLPATLEQNNSQPGTVNVLVIPDIKGKLPFNPFEPKMPSDTLFQIRQFLDDHAPAYAEIAVRNPSYLQIKIRCVVKFKPGYNEGFYKPKLVDEIKQFLAPWAYNADGNITIGGTIYASVIINFIAERPYIDYVANMKLFQSEDGKQFTDVRTLNDGKNKVIAVRPDTVLVSAQSHEIDIVDENGYDEADFEGINYWQVGLDFEVSNSTLS